MALSRHHAAISKPISVEEIVHLAQQYEFGSNRPLKAWMRSAQMLLTEAAHWEQDNNLQTAYLYLYRHAELVLGSFPKHPEYKDPKLKADLTQARQVVQRNLAKLEQWRPRLKYEHERYLKAIERRNAEGQRIQNERLNDERERSSNDWESEDAHERAQSLNVYENRQLAVDLAHRELRRRDASRQSTYQAGIPPDTVASRRRGVVLNPDEVKPTHQYEYDRVSEGVREAGRHLNRSSHHENNEDGADWRPTMRTTYQYPSVPTKEDVVDWKPSNVQTGLRPVLSAPPPARPAKEAPNTSFAKLSLKAPPIPAKSKDSTAFSPSTRTPSPPPINQTSSSKYIFKPTAFTEAGGALRTVLLPPELRRTFLNLAHSNTARNLETCGILCGTLVSNALFINHLVIPDQQSTSDTCDTTEEGDNELFDFCDSNELLVCGWIHTHPSQTCFLSSRDLHTSAGYQVMLPEAIAIVCAPRQNPDWGIFRLTDPPGLNHILNCQQRSLFHPHSETNLYTDAIKPGHVVEGPGLKFEVVDLRKR